MENSVKHELAVFDSAAYKRSRTAYFWECAFEYFANLLVADVFLAAYLQKMEMPDATIGIMSSLVTLTQFVLLFTIFCVRQVAEKRGIMIVCHFVPTLFFSLMYLVLFLPVSREVQWGLIIVCLVVGYFGRYFVTSFIYRWGNAFVASERLGTFTSLKEAASLLTGLVVTLGLGYVMDIFLALDDAASAFLLIAIAIAVFAVADLVCLLLMDREPMAEETQEQKQEQSAQPPVREAMKYVFSQPSFRESLISATLYSIAIYCTVPFLGAYKLNIGFSAFAAQIINAVGIICRALASRPFGRYFDRHSFIQGIELGNLITAASFVFLFFAGEGPWHYFFILYFIVYAIGNCNGAGYINILIHDLGPEYFVQANAIRCCLGGVVAFLSTLVAGAVYDQLEALGLTLCGMSISAPQVFALFSCALLLVNVLYTYSCRKKHKKQA